MPDVTIGQSGQGSDRRRDLSLLPFRGLRYTAGRHSDLAPLTSPPYDVVDAEGVLTLESADEHNVVRLILPRDADSGPEGRYEHAAATLRHWLADNVLEVDPTPGVYLYEQATAAGVVQRGLLGAVGLRDPAERIVLPHEDVMPGPVADRLELMRAARANVEPILLMYDGAGGVTGDVVRRVADEPALATARTADGIVHRIWQLSDPVDLQAIAADLGDRQALIADGHHRYAAYRALQAELEASEGPGAWDSGLALLVDLRAYPPQIGAIHRSVSGLTLDEALLAVEPLFSVVCQEVDDLEEAAAGLLQGELLVVDGHGRGAWLRVQDLDAVEDLIAVDQPEQWRHLDTAVLHRVLIEHLWKADEDRVGYHHDVAGARRAAERTAGLVVLLAPVTVESVLELAAEGVRMPRKSTSFGPKPRTGLVLRTFDAG